MQSVFLLSEIANIHDIHKSTVEKAQKSDFAITSAELRSGSEQGLYVRCIHFFITPL